jgi:hypothetical protein
MFKRRRHASALGLVMLAAGASAAVQSCSPKEEKDGAGAGGFGSQPAYTGGGASANGGNGTGLSGNGNGTGSGGLSQENSGGSFTLPGGGQGGKRGDEECAKVVQKPETVYIDGSVTDTIVTYSPIALYVMIDRSSSMVGLTGDPNSWPNAQSALTAFVNDPASAGLDIGLGAFPPMSNNNMPDCAGGTDCGAPIVQIAPLPNNASAIVTALQQATPPVFPPLTTPTECGLRGMINECLNYKMQASEDCVAILVTDGAPSSCDVNAQNLANLVADGKTKGILTFTLGLPGSNQAFLDQLAQAGGTTASIPITSQQAFLQALTAIRGKVSRTETTHTSTPVFAPSPCSWEIPPPKDGKAFDRNKVNLELTPLNGVPSSFVRFDNEAACAGANNGWRYDIDAKDLTKDPKQVILCPATCNMVKASSGASVDIAFGCATKVTM